MSTTGRGETGIRQTRQQGSERRYDAIAGRLQLGCDDRENWEGERTKRLSVDEQIVKHTGRESSLNVHIIGM